MDPMGYGKNKSHVPKKTPDLLPSGSRIAAAKTRSFPGLGVDGRLWVWKGRTVVAPKSNGYQSGYLSLSIMENMGYLYVISIIFMITGHSFSPARVDSKLKRSGRMMSTIRPPRSEVKSQKACMSLPYCFVTSLLRNSIPILQSSLVQPQFKLVSNLLSMEIRKAFGQKIA